MAIAPEPPRPPGLCSPDLDTGQTSGPLSGRTILPAQAVDRAGEGASGRPDVGGGLRQVENNGELAQDLLDSIFRVATEVVRGERASLMLRDDEDADFVISRAVGLADDVMKQARVRIGEGVAGRVAAERKPMLAVAGTEIQGARGTYKTGSFVSVPIVVNDVARGVLNIADPSEDRDFAQDDLATLEILR